MNTFRPFRSRYLTALVLAVCAAAVSYLPPTYLAARLDGWLYDAWSRLFSPSNPTGIVLVDLPDPAWLTTLADIADRDGSRLLITTLPDPPSERVNAIALGPTQLVLGTQLLRSTNWKRGGHLWFDDDVDGRVRIDQPYIADATELRSLALTAHQLLDPEAPTDLTRNHIRFFDRAAFEYLTPDDLQVGTGHLAGRVVIAGQPIPEVETPVGWLARHEVLAHALASYNAGALIGTSDYADAAPWLLALLLLGYVGWRPRRFARQRWLLPATGSLCLLTLSNVAYAALDTWVPVFGPEILIMTASALLISRRQRRQVHRSKSNALDDAREALSDGRVEDAWLRYREIPATGPLLDELYELGAALEAHEYPELAADAFYRVAVVNPRFRDVARRLVAATHEPARSAKHPSEPLPEAAEALSAAAADRGPSMPERLGRYELLELIGKGSTGQVFLALDPTINRIVALKVINLRAEYDDDEIDEGKERFEREAATAGRLNHPGIVTIFDIGESHGLAYIAMEYLKGRHLSAFTEPDSLLPPGLVLELGARTAEALDYAHERNVVHRDIKPSNIMYDSVSGDLKITDFGIARLIDVSRTRTGIVLGTPSFMAPEQLEGENVNRHTDLFALGVTLYELLTGRLPFRGASMTKLMFVIANEPHEPISGLRPDLPPQLDSVIDIALSKRPDDRYDRGLEMAEALRGAASQIA